MERCRRKHLDYLMSEDTDFGSDGVSCDRVLFGDVCCGDQCPTVNLKYNRSSLTLFMGFESVFSRCEKLLTLKIAEQLRMTHTIAYSDVTILPRIPRAISNCIALTRVPPLCNKGKNTSARKYIPGRCAPTRLVLPRKGTPRFSMKLAGLNFRYALI